MTFDILWSLSFNADIQEQLRANQAFVSKLVQLAKECHDEKTRKITHGILWNLESRHNEYKIQEENQGATFDIMISYSHADKELCKRLYEALVQEGFRVWIDFDQMHGNVMDAMAHAIERSNTILICMSEHYRRSNYCRAEAHYAFRRRLKIVPVLLQKHYKPDGWLLFLIGQLLYVDFIKYEFSQAFNMLLKELKAPILSDTPRQSISLSQEPDIVVSNLPLQLATSLPTELPDNLSEWSQAQVSAWLIEHNLNQMACLLADYDGESLIYLNQLIVNDKLPNVLKSLEEECIRRTKQSLSLIEFARFRGLINKQQQQQQRGLVQRKPASQQKKTNHRKKKCDSVVNCHTM